MVKDNKFCLIFRDGVSCLKQLTAIILIVAFALLSTSCGDGTAKSKSTKQEHVDPETINRVLDTIDYYITDKCSVNLRTLINDAVENQSNKYNTYSDAKTKILENFDGLDESLFNEIEDGEYASYLATSYIVTIHGDVWRNPSIKDKGVEAMIDRDVDALIILLYFDASGNYIANKPLLAAKTFTTFVTLYATENFGAELYY